MKKQEEKMLEKQEKIITKDMTINEIVQKYPETQKVFLKYGMTCFGCPFALQETLEQGCLAHGIDVDKIIKELNKLNQIKSKDKK